MKLTGPQAAALTVLGNAVAPMSKRALIDAALDMRAVNRLVVLGLAATNGSEYWVVRPETKVHGDEIMPEDGPLLDHEADTREDEYSHEEAVEKRAPEQTPGERLVKKIVRKPRETKPMHNCLCGCGALATSHFKQGHDARLKGTMHKFLNGKETGVPQYPAETLEYLRTASWTKPEYLKHLGVAR